MAQFQNIEEFCYHLSLNHDVAPEQGKDGDIVYSASSPDENALVSFARHLGYYFFKRSTSTGTVQNVRLNRDIDFTILNVLPFSSKRKRSSVIVRRPDNTLVLYCKGADNIILERYFFDFLFFGIWWFTPPISVSPLSTSNL